MAYGIELIYTKDSSYFLQTNIFFETMKVLIINSILYTPERGIISQVTSIKDTMIYNLASTFKQLGHEVTLIAALDYAPIVKEEYLFKVHFLKSNFPKLFLPSVLPLHLSLIHFLRKEKRKYDLILSSEVFSFNSLFASIVAPYKTIIWQELGQHNHKMKKIPSKIWYNIIAPIFMRRALVVPRSPKAGRFLRKFHLNVFPDFIDHGVNMNKLHPNKFKKKQFIIVARLVPGKNIISIIEKYQTFLHKYHLTEYKLYIAGEGPCRREITQYLEYNNLNKQIILLGNIPHELLGKYLSESSCMLCNSKMELNMIAIGESVSVGTPVITNTVPYSHEWIVENKLGIAKDIWNEDDIYKIVINNSEYVDNCLEFGKRLSLQSVTNEFIKLINNGKTQNFNS